MDARVLNGQGQPLLLRGLWAESRVVLVFLRQLGERLAQYIDNLVTLDRYGPPGSIHV